MYKNSCAHRMKLGQKPSNFQKNETDARSRGDFSGSGARSAHNERENDYVRELVFKKTSTSEKFAVTGLHREQRKIFAKRILISPSLFFPLVT